MAVAECMGKAIVDGKLKKKTFEDAYFVANQAHIFGKTVNRLVKYTDQE